jgi:hypothetical protein
MEAVEGAKELKFEGGEGGLPVPEKVQPLTGVRGMSRTVPDRRRQKAGWRGAWQRAGHM